MAPVLRLMTSKVTLQRGLLICRWAFSTTAARIMSTTARRLASSTRKRSLWPKRACAPTRCRAVASGTSESNWWRASVAAAEASRSWRGLTSRNAMIAISFFAAWVVGSSPPGAPAAMWHRSRTAAASTFNSSFARRLCLRPAAAAVLLNLRFSRPRLRILGVLRSLRQQLCQMQLRQY